MEDPRFGDKGGFISEFEIFQEPDCFISKANSAPEQPYKNSIKMGFCQAWAYNPRIRQGGLGSGTDYATAFVFEDKIYAGLCSNFALLLRH